MFFYYYKMSKLNEAEAITDVGNNDKKEETLLSEEAKQNDIVDNAEITEEKYIKTENEKKDILRFTMLFNKYNCFLDMKRNPKNDGNKWDNKYAMFFNKEVTIRPNPEISFATGKTMDAKKKGSLDREDRQCIFRRALRNKPRFYFQNNPAPKPQISDPGMMFFTSLTSSPPDVFESKAESKTETLKKIRRNPKVELDSLVQLNVYPATQTYLKIHNSLTNLSKNNKVGLRGVMKSKIPSLTALDTNSVQPKSELTRFGCWWDHWDDLMLMQSDVDKRLNLQISRSSNDNSRCTLKFKKEDAASVSDSKLLYTDSESKKHIKKCDKKSRGDSSRKEKESGNKKQVQWKTEVDVIYFSTHLAANGDRMGEVIGRVMEPLREEWEQQRKGFYAKVVPSHIESHMKDRFISLLKI